VPTDEDAPPESEPPFEPPVPNEPAEPIQPARPAYAGADGWYDGPVAADEAIGIRETGDAPAAGTASGTAPDTRTSNGGAPRTSASPSSSATGAAGGSATGAAGGSETGAAGGSATGAAGGSATGAATTPTSQRDQPSAGARESSGSGRPQKVEAAESRVPSSVAFQEPQRYGEAVVRELLGATFIEEQPASRGER
jgi:DNA polymerase-3 subunit gamma/tau